MLCCSGSQFQLYYLLSEEFVLYSNYLSLWYIQSQKKLSVRNIKWVEFFQDYTFVLKYKVGIKNKATNALSRIVTILQSMSTEVVSFERMKDDYLDYPDFALIFQEVNTKNHWKYVDFVIKNGYLFRGYCLCIPRTYLWDFLIWELHARGLFRLFGHNKAISLVENWLYWPSLKRDMAIVLIQCHTC